MRPSGISWGKWWDPEWRNQSKITKISHFGGIQRKFHWTDVGQLIFK